MDNKEFYIMFENLVDEERKIMCDKGKEYTKGSKDKLKNFKEIAERISITPLQVWATYYLKHQFSLEHFLNGGEISSGESIRSRIIDLRNYLVLGLALIEEEDKIKKGDFSNIAPGTPTLINQDISYNPRRC